MSNSSHRPDGRRPPSRGGGTRSRAAEPRFGERRRMSFRLVPLIKKTAPIIELQRPILLIGRHMDCDVRLDAPKISRRHCCVAMAYDRLLIRDLGSLNGVRLNGRVI